MNKNLRNQRKIFLIIFIISFPILLLFGAVLVLRVTDPEGELLCGGGSAVVFDIDTSDCMSRGDSAEKCMQKIRFYL